jgi:hypothetical protein
LIFIHILRLIDHQKHFVIRPISTSLLRIFSMAVVTIPADFSILRVLPIYSIAEGMDRLVFNVSGGIPIKSHQPLLEFRCGSARKCHHHQRLRCSHLPSEAVKQVYGPATSVVRFRVLQQPQYIRILIINHFPLSGRQRFKQLPVFCRGKVSFVFLLLEPGKYLARKEE